MAIDWKTIISEFDGKPTLLQAIGKLRKAVEEETITIQQAQAEIAKLESQQKVDEALINTKQDKLNDKSDVTVLYLTATNGINAGTVKTGEVSDDEDNVYNFPKKAGTFALVDDVNAVGTKAQNALDLATTNETDIATLDGQVAVLETKTNVLPDDKPALAVVLCSNPNNKMYYVPYREYAGSGTTIPIFNSNGRLRSKKGGTGDEVATMDDIQGGFKTFEGITTKSFTIDSSAPFTYNEKLLLSPSTSLSPILLENGVKTLFGNQSIVGTGNIDLYYHYVAVTITNVKYPLHIDFYSSKSLKCDSLTDLKTLLGDTFERALFGSATTGAAGAFYGNFLSNSGAHGIIVGSSTVSAKYYEWTDITINDTVTTI